MIARPPATDIYRAVAKFADAGRQFALATILKTAGSTPRQAGTKALIDSKGAIWGTIGGGQAEAEAQRLAIQAIGARQPIVFDFTLAGESAEETQPICGGSMRILIDPAVAGHRAAYAQAAEARDRRQRGILLTRVHVGPSAQVFVQWLPQDSIPADLDEPARSAMRTNTPQLCTHKSKAGEHLETLVEPVIPPPLLLIAGGGHIGQALASQAAWVGFDVAVIDDRSEFLAPSLYPPGVTTRCGDMAQALAEFPVDGDTYITVVTRGHIQDQRALAACIHKPAAYLGMIGSRRKVAMIRQALLDSGIATEEQLARVHAPIGLDIGAQTVPEIAVSIVAELIAVRRKGQGREGR